MKRNYQFSIRRTPGRLLGLAFIRLYQLTLSPWLGRQCRYLPTCSEYAYEAIARHGLWAGGWLTFFRLISCHPWGGCGYHPVVASLPAHCRWFTVWRYYKAAKNADEAG